MIVEQRKFASDVLPVLNVSQNIALFGRREVGKTTFFFDCLTNFVHSFDGKIFVIDSATAHKDKSLIAKIKECHTNINCIESFDCDKDAVFEELSKIIDLRDDVISLIDVSRFLEESYMFENEERHNIREKYKKFVEICISFISNTFEKFVIFMDEIELTDEAANILNSIKKGGTYFSIIHDISYITNLNNYLLFNVDRILLNCCNSVYKPPDQLCGNACAEIVAALFYAKEGHTNTDLFWCSDIAYYLAQKKIAIEVSCWESTLYSDYTLDRDYTHPGFASIKRYEDNFSSISQTPITYSQILFELNANKCIICCVSSSIFNNDYSLTGGHYIVVYKDKDTYCCLTPKKNRILKEYMDIKRLVNACSSYGGWRILCN